MRIAVGLLVGLLASQEAAAQNCQIGQVTTGDAAGHCCWPGQVWSKLKNACLGDPDCPTGTTASGAGCVAAALPASPQRQAAAERAARGDALAKQNRVPEAEAEYRAALAADPTWHEIEYRLGNLFEGAGRLDEAVAMYRAFLPYAPPELAAVLHPHVGQLQVQLDDQRRAAQARAEAEARQREEEAQRQARAQQEAAEQARRAAEEAKQAVTIRNLSSNDSITHVSLELANGQTLSCPDLAPQASCVLHPPPGPATLTWSGSDDNRTLLAIPSGRTEATLKAGPGNGVKVGLLLGGIGSLGGGIGLLALSNGNTGMLIAGGACFVVVIGLAITIPLVLGDDEQFGPEPPSPGTSSLAGTWTRPALSLAPTPGGGRLALAFSF